MSILGTHIRKRKKGESSGLAVLFDPDECKKDSALEEKVRSLSENRVDLILIGGSLLIDDAFQSTLERIRSNSDLPIVLFPGSPMQLSERADATLFLSLISGRNPEYLIGQHVQAAPHLKRMNCEVIPTGYMLVEGGRPTTASYMSDSSPIPRDKNDIATSTALAGEMLGMDSIYLDAGSGAEEAVPPEMIEAVSSNLEIPVIVGGGIRDPQKMEAAMDAGADLVVIGSAFEADSRFFEEMEKKGALPRN